MSTLLQPYEVPLVYYDLTTSLTLEDTLFSLTQLSSTVDLVFSKINQKLNDEKQKITKINERVSTCSGKINLVRGSNKATTIFSTAKFPMTKKIMTRDSLFSINEDVPNPYPEAEDDVHYIPPAATSSILSNKELSLEIQQMQSKLNSYGTDMLRSEFIMEDQGLGKIPTGIQTVGSILLFNSDTNPYKNYQALDNLISSGRAKETQEEAARGLASAPSTLISGEALPDIAALDLTYKPQMGELSALALPSNLPLDFLADIHFDGSALPSIAPSAHRGAADYSLPQITDGTTTGSAFAASSQYAPNPSAKQPPPAPNSAPPPPPPSAAPPPPPPSSAPPPPPPPAASAPPPPPPPQASAPPPPPPPTANIGDIDEGDDSGSPAPAGRNSLLDAIKGMSVTKLRSKEEAQVAAAKTQRAVEASKPVSMMDEMRLRMQRRNNAISGKTSREQTRNDSMLFKPPPPSSSSAEGGGATATTRSSISKVFKPTDDDDDSDAQSEISDAVSEVSIDSFKRPAAPMIPPPQPKIPPPAAATAPPVAPPPPQGRRGSLLDASNPTVASLLNNAKKKAAGSDSDESDSGEDDDWD